MGIQIDGSANTISGLAVGGLPNGSISSDDIASNAVTVAKLASTLDLSSNTVTLPNTSVTAGMLASTLDISGKTVTLPNTSVTAGMLASTLDLSSKTVTLPSGTGGKILQVLQDTKTDIFSTSNSIASASTITGLSQAVTMSASSNKVLVMAQIFVSGDSNSEVGLSLYRGSTQIYLGDTGTAVECSIPAGMLWSSGSWQGQSACITFLDTPGTGTHTYTVRIGGNGGSTIYVNRTGRNGTSDPIGASSITLMEVAAS